MHLPRQGLHPPRARLDAQLDRRAELHVVLEVLVISPTSPARACTLPGRAWMTSLTAASSLMSSL